tara:strand:+ start:44948 stop:45130 length:183 start_codon:yes stop_codon:yes gene_type:complete
MSSEVMNQIHTVKEVAGILGVTDSYIRRLCLENKLGTRKGRDRLLTNDDIQQLRKILPNA